MGRILIAITGQNGILNASLELARRLAADGHELHLAAPRPVGERITREGWAFTELPEIRMEPAELPPLGKGPVDKLKGLMKRYLKRNRLQSEALENTRPFAFIKLLDEFAPDLTLIDIELHEYVFATYGHKRSFVLLSQWYSIWREAGLPYQLTDVIPGAGETGTSAAINAIWKKTEAQRAKMFARIARLSAGADRRSTLLRFAKESGVGAEQFSFPFWPGPIAYDEWPVLVMAPLEMEFPHNQKQNLHYVGPMVHTGRKENPGISHRGERLEDIISRAEAGDKKIILVTVSTLHLGDADFLRRLVSAVILKTDWTIILGLGGKLTVKDLVAGGRSPAVREKALDRIIPENVHAFTYVPQLRVLKGADLSINHGGIHTIHECLHFGVPMLVYSGKRSDQPGCAARVHYHEVGVKADKDVDSATDICTKIVEVLNGPYADNVRQMRDRASRYADTKTVERLVQGFINDKNTQ